MSFGDKRRRLKKIQCLVGKTIAISIHATGEGVDKLDS